ncbi:MAG: peptidase M16 [Nitrospinota bacterium]|nr:MAG: peptidase M16 [Nitrospinota bacterium]
MTTLHGFELIREQEIPELKTTARLFRHIQTGAEVLSLENDDENKVFGITFRTPPADSTGLPHILEHSVLCGSRKYPVKEPFVELLKGSLQTFLNAMTYPDKTCYPVASQNLQDFYNLIDVYLDAVFYPRLTPHIFQQEGWHYELEKPEDPLTIKGVVYNEMKGAYSSPDRVLAEYAQQSLFPDTIYRFDSGGDPREIPNLTYAQFKKFHQTYYHPSNARIFFYGNDDPEERLRILAAYLQDFAPLPVEATVPLQPRFDQPRRLHRSYMVGQEEKGKKGMTTVNWLLDETTDPEKTLALHILAHILIGTPASPLRKALIDSGLGEDLAGVGLEGDLRQMYFSTGLKGMAVEDADRVEVLILETLTRLAQEGIDPETVEASLNTVEFRLRENNTGSYPRGLVLMLRALVTWLYGADPLAPIAFAAPLTAIKSRVKAGERYFESLLTRYFLQNPHRTTLILQPDPELGPREEAAEKARLAEIRARLRAEEVQAIIENTQTLKRLQETPDPPEALATIPSLKLSDLDRKVKTVPLAVLEQQGTPVLYHDLFTNGILYLDVGFNLHALPQEYLPYLPLFGRALLEIGTEKEDFVRLSQRIGRKTGGIWPTSFTSMIRGTDRGAAWLFLRSKAMTSQVDDLLAILKDVLLTVRFDNQERFRQMVLEEKAEQEEEVLYSGHSLVSLRLRSCFNEADWAAEQMGGVSYLFFLRRLVQEVEENWSQVLSTLEEIRRLLLNRNTMLCNVTLDEANWTPIAPKLEAFLSALPAASPALVTWSPHYGSGFEGMTIPSQVNYVGKGANIYRLGYTLHGSAAVIIRYLRTTWIWDRVRVQGGAYGGFCLFDHRSGVLNFASYRDPNLLKTLEVYDQTGHFLRHTPLREEELTKSIIGAIGDMDAYQLPDAKGYSSMLRYLVGETDELRQQRREEIFSTSVADFRAFADVLDRVREEGRVVVLGSPSAIEEVNTLRPGWLKVFQVL